MKSETLKSFSAASGSFSATSFLNRLRGRRGRGSFNNENVNAKCGLTRKFEASCTCVQQGYVYSENREISCHIYEHFFFAAKFTLQFAATRHF